MQQPVGRVDPANLLQFNLNGSMTCTSGQTAHLLGLSDTTFLRRLRKGQFPGFPQKLPGTNKWSRPAVVAWISSNGQATAPQPRGIPYGDPEIEALVSDLEQTYGVAS